MSPNRGLRFLRRFIEALEDKVLWSVCLKYRFWKILLQSYKYLTKRRLLWVEETAVRQKVKGSSIHSGRNVRANRRLPLKRVELLISPCGETISHVVSPYTSLYRPFFVAARTLSPDCRYCLPGFTDTVLSVGLKSPLFDCGFVGPL